MTEDLKALIEAAKKVNPSPEHREKHVEQLRLREHGI